MSRRDRVWCYDGGSCDDLVSGNAQVSGDAKVSNNNEHCENAKEYVSPPVSVAPRVSGDDRVKKNGGVWGGGDGGVVVKGARGGGHGALESRFYVIMNVGKLNHEI